MESYDMCTQIIYEMSDRHKWMGLFMFCFVLFVGVVFQKIQDGETIKTLE